MIHHTLKLILQINFSKVNHDVYEQPEDINCVSLMLLKNIPSSINLKLTVNLLTGEFITA